MVRQDIDIDGYWKVIVFYNLDYGLFHIIYKVLKAIGFTDAHIRRIYNMLKSGKAKAVTCSNPLYHISIILLTPHPFIPDFISSVVHEAEHVKQAMLEAYDVEDEGEPPAYTIGYIVMRMYGVFKTFIFRNH